MKLTNGEKILTYLKENDGWYCDRCLSKECNISSSNSVYSECTYLKQIKKIERKTSKCCKCGKNVLVSSLPVINKSDNEGYLKTDVDNCSEENVILVNRKRKTHEKSIMEFLHKNNLEYCDDCLSKLCKIEPRQTVNQICRKVYKSNKIVRGYSKCSYCNKSKITNSINT